MYCDYQIREAVFPRYTDIRCMYDTTETRSCQRSENMEHEVRELETVVKRLAKRLQNMDTRVKSRQSEKKTA